jgi:excisionase family DNA binding protein
MAHMFYAADMSQHVDDQARDMPGRRRVTVEEAAKLLGLSGNAIRKRLERGTLRSEKVNGVRYVLLDSGMPQHADDMPNGMSGDIALMKSHLDSMSQQIDYLKGVIEKRDEEIRRRDHLLAAALERIPAIEEAPSPEPRESDLTASEEPGGVRRGRPVSQEPEQRRSWLYRFFFGP